MKSLGAFFRRCTPRTASSIPWFTRYSASYRCAFSMTKRPFSGEAAASSEVDRCAEAHVLVAVESRCGGQTDPVGRNYGGGCATRQGTERAMETKRRRARCAPKGNPIPFVTAIVASNSGDFG